MQVPPLQKRFRKATRPQYEAVFATLFPKLQSALPAFLIYHNASHIKGVIRDADYLIAKEGIPAEDRWMILTAALFHDAGFLRVYNDHEINSCLLACRLAKNRRAAREGQRLPPVETNDLFRDGRDGQRKRRPRIVPSLDGQIRDGKQQRVFVGRDVSVRRRTP